MFGIVYAVSRPWMTLSDVSAWSETKWLNKNNYISVHKQPTLTWSGDKPGGTQAYSSRAHPLSSSDAADVPAAQLLWCPEPDDTPAATPTDGEPPLYEFWCRRALPDTDRATTGDVTVLDSVSGWQRPTLPAEPGIDVVESLNGAATVAE